MKRVIDVQLEWNELDEEQTCLKEIVKFAESFSNLGLGVRVIRRVGEVTCVACWAACLRQAPPRPPSRVLASCLVWGLLVFVLECYDSWFVVASPKRTISGNDTEIEWRIEMMSKQRGTEWRWRWKGQREYTIVFAISGYNDLFNCWVLSP